MAVNSSRCSASHPRRAGFGQGLALAVLCFVLTGLPAYAVSRNVRIQAPTSAVAGSKVTAKIIASTDAGGGEQIGFFHADYSVDGGRTWIPISGSTREGPTAAHSVTFTAGEAGSVVIVRVRIAFREGKAGDVDYSGKKIDWENSWAKWQEPPAKTARITIVAP